MDHITPSTPLETAVSARQFWQPDLPDVVRDALHSSGLSPHLLTLEITESVLLDVPDAAQILGALHALGVRLSLDDFGTGSATCTACPCTA
ncbi:EAL domain-containing protein [Deinococcus soli (ex Cha et al. 2016)]|uniref:EAL domain-containing protein n=1 Tax=Deinococcus soli (ex Cha et al. 2016) TaxID=1309411 RepID=UPI0019A9D49D|nr:EAL domain-containing protein [Deinococcus soli (ex Cha et al. 2016)]GGB68610.1 hypothetical protein GCM10008019_26030 [Deinococcus soli (ex Cha et al. 2016)]